VNDGRSQVRDLIDWLDGARSPEPNRPRISLSAESVICTLHLLDESQDGSLAADLEERLSLAYPAHCMGRDLCKALQGLAGAGDTQRGLAATLAQRMLSKAGKTLKE
jgi:hypothetical protein